MGSPADATEVGTWRLWTATTTNGSFLITWQDFALGRIPAATNTSYLLPRISST